MHWKRIKDGKVVAFGSTRKLPDGAERISGAEYRELVQSLPEPSEPEEVAEPEVAPLRAELNDILERLTRLEEG